MSQQQFSRRRRQRPAPTHPFGGHHHSVQFYRSEAYLCRQVCAFLAPGLRNGNALVVIARPEHSEAFTEQLKADGFDVDRAKASKQFMDFDAEETLATFMNGELPDAERFLRVIGQILDQSRVGRENLHVLAYGEMVDILWREGKCDAAIRLEELWNHLAATRPFRLLCAYGMEGFHKSVHRPQFEEICRNHAEVFPTEHLVEAAENARLLEMARLEQRALALESEIEHRKQVEQSLRKTENEFRSLLEKAVEGLHWVGPDGVILWANQAELDLLGYTREEYIGRHVSEFHVDAEAIREILNGLSRGETLHNFEVQLRCKDGSVRDVLIDSNVLFEDGRFVHTQCFTRDITARKRAEVERDELLRREQRARSEAEAANRLKDEFLAILSHELRTPLNAILGWTSILSSRQDEHLIRRSVETIQRNAAMQKRLIEDLLDMARILTGKLTIKSERVDLPAVLQAAVDTVRPAAIAKGIDVDLEISESARFITGDGDRLQQVIWNLLSNALKFTPQSGRVEVRVQAGTGYVEISVHDTGQGISPDFLPHVFERFRQADGSTGRQHGGLGVGLAVVRHLVEAHGGTISADSGGEGQGSTFVVRLPMRQSAAA
jgi:PAS domain S-box-containing protein